MLTVNLHIVERNSQDHWTLLRWAVLHQQLAVRLAYKYCYKILHITSLKELPLHLWWSSAKVSLGITE